MKLYIAGPMSGIPQFNYPAFNNAAKALRQAGYDVRNPTEMDDKETQRAALASPDGRFTNGMVGGETWGDLLSRDVKVVADEVDGVCLLSGWEKSRGARLEAYVAVNVGKPVFYLIHNEPMEMGESYIMNRILYGTLNQGDTSRYGGNNES